MIHAKGRKVKGLDSKVQEACNSLSPIGGQELFKLCKRIELSYNYRKVALKAIHNQRNNDEDARTARVWNFIDQNPNHPIIKNAEVKKPNYWER
jgi:hypothetical protein